MRPKTPPPEAVGALKPYHHGDLRRALLNAADALLERVGMAALSLRAVAREAGVSPAAPYHHFKDKHELLSAIAREGFQRLKLAMAEAERRADPTENRGTVFGLAYVDFAQRHPALYRAMYDCARRDEAMPGIASEDDGFGLVKQAIADASGAEVSETDVHLAAIAAWCTAHGLAEMRGFAQFRALKDNLGGEEAFLRSVLDHVGALTGAKPGAR